MATGSISVATEGRLQERRNQEERRQLIADLMAIVEHCASLPILDDRTGDEILGYEENGLPS